MKSLSIPVETYRHGEEYSATCLGVFASGRSLTQLRRQLMTAIETGMQAQQQAQQHWQRRMIFCRDGTVLLVEHRHGSWGYHIAGANREHSSSSASTSKTLEDELRSAVAHAEQSYGGVANILSLS